MSQQSMETAAVKYDVTEACARKLDETDALRACREWYELPYGDDGQTRAYFTGNSLGCLPRATREALQIELDDWSRLAVDAHFDGKHPWFRYHEELREAAEHIVGAKPGSGEVVVMNSLTVNLHLMMVSFYRPTKQRYKIVVEDDCFPSDSYAVQSQAAFHAACVGFDVDDAVVRLRPREGEATLRTEDVVQTIRQHGDSVALVMMGGVNYLTGQFFEIESITNAAHEVGAVAGWDLAHAAGNVLLRLHEWGVDFACWCSYKYLNAGPGAVAGCFVHEKHVGNTAAPVEGGLHRFAGWWGNDPTERFKMDKRFVPAASAESWQLSNPPIMAMAPARASYELFKKIGMPALRAKSEKLTGYLEFLLDQLPAGSVRVLTPREPKQRGCQLSLAFDRNAKGLHEKMHEAGIVTDFREPNVIRVAPVPMYNTFYDVWRFVSVLQEHVTL